MTVKLPNVCKDLLVLKYLCKKQRSQSTKEITNCDRFWIRKCNKNFKNLITKCSGITKCDKFGLQIAMGLQSKTDYKMIQYNPDGVLYEYYAM